MVRTRSDCSGIRVGTKASFKSPASSSGGGSSSGKSSRRGYGSGNRYCPRETPPWQKEITKFFNTSTDAGSNSSGIEEGASNSSSSSSSSSNKQ